MGGRCAVLGAVVQEDRLDGGVAIQEADQFSSAVAAISDDADF